MSALPTLKKISEHLNISISTVSRALKDHPDVSPETIKRVKDLANLMEYEPNGFAVNLRRKRSDTYAILVPEISGFFYHSFIQAVEEDARRNGYGVMIMQSMNDPSVEAENLRICRYNHVAGVFASICAGTTDLAPFLKTQEIGIPVVFFDKVPQAENFTSISIPDETAAALAAKHISTSGKTNCWCILGAPTLSITRKRRSGFVEAMQELGKPTPEISYTNNEETAWKLVTDKGRDLLKDTSIFCMSDQLLCGVMRGLYQLKAEIPGEVSVLSMSNGFMPRYFNPVISYVETSGYKLGKASFAAMEHKLSGVDDVLVKEELECRFFEGASL